MADVKVTQVARSVPFDNSTNGFVSTDTQAAIEESGQGKKLKYKAHKIHVATNGDDTNGDGTHHNPFLTIYRAIQFINGLGNATEETPYNILVGPGTYIERLLVVPQFVSIVGQSIQKTIIEPDGNHDIIHVTNSSEFSFLTLQGATAGYAAINASNCGEYGQCHKVSIYDCDIGLIVNVSTVDSQFYAEYLDINGVYSYGVIVTTTDGYAADVYLENFWTFPTSQSVQCYVNGSLANAEFRSAILFGGYGQDTGILVGANGGNIRIVSGTIHDFYKGLHTLSSSTPVYIHTTGIAYVNCATDIQVDGSNVSGTIFGVATRSKIVNNSPNTILFTYQDRDNGDLNNNRILATRGFATDLNIVRSTCGGGRRLYIRADSCTAACNGIKVGTPVLGV
jgi:hypothetical protein